MLRVYFLSLLLPLLAGAQSAVTLTRAKAHFKQGAAFYNAGLYDRAINEYQAAYQLVPLADLLFNLAQAHLKRGDRQEALDHYQKYLAADPGGAARAEAQARVNELSAALKAEHAAAAERAAASERQARAASQEQAAAAAAAAERRSAAERVELAERERSSQLDRDRRRARGEKIAGLTVGAVGIVSLALGATFVGLAKSANDQLLHPAGGIYVPGAEDRRSTYQTLDVAFFVVGGAAVAGGLALYLVGRRAERRF